jgi:DNA binding domain, excisionase family
MEALVDARAVAVLLDVTPETVIKRAKAGDLPFVPMGRLYRFRLTDVDAFLSAPRSLQPARSRTRKRVT